MCPCVVVMAVTGWRDTPLYIEYVVRRFCLNVCVESKFSCCDVAPVSVSSTSTARGSAAAIHVMYDYQCRYQKWASCRAHVLATGAP